MINSDPNDPLLEIADIADRLGIKVASVRRYIARNDLPEPDTRVGRSPLWKTSTIERWERSRSGHGWRHGQTGSIRKNT